MSSTLFLLTLGFFTLFESGDARVARTPLGDIIGNVQKSRDGKEYYAFLKIPYAKPPVGIRRFKNPEPGGAWKGLLDGRERPPFCPQIVIHSPRKPKYVVGEEDCLYLNIFTLSHKLGMKMSVMVYFVGDNFRYGMANDPQLANFLIDENIVLVIVQHRLGALGFMSLEDDVLTGNFGLKDQAMAVSWVKKYIKFFGGNPHSITVFGDGSGGASAHFLALSHTTKDAVKSVISQGGVGNEIWALAKPGKARETAQKALKILQCDQKPDVVECLRQKSAQEIMRTEYDLIYWDMEPNVVFQPVIEKSKFGSFFYENPLKPNSDFPWMVGFTSDEGQYKIYSMETQKTDELKPFLQNYRYFIKEMLYATNSSIETVDRLLQRYFLNLSDRQATLKGLKQFYGDLNYVAPTFQALRKHVGPSYLYVFDYKFAASPQAASEKNNFQGSPHAEETVALFDWGEPFANSSEENVSRMTVKMWANFAKYQKPTAGRLQWPQYKKGEYLLIKENPTVEKSYRKSDIDFWLDLPIFN